MLFYVNLWNDPSRRKLMHLACDSRECLVYLWNASWSILLVVNPPHVIRYVSPVEPF